MKPLLYSMANKLKLYCGRNLASDVDAGQAGVISVGLPPNADLADWSPWQC